MHELQGLHDELGFSDAARAALDVEIAGGPRHVSRDICLDTPQ